MLIKRHWVMSLTAVAVLIFGGYMYFRSETSTITSNTASRTVTAEKSDLRVVVSGSGLVEADSQVDLKPVVAGDAIEVTMVAVKNDQEVKKDQVIAVLDNQDAARDVVSAELSLRQARTKEKQTADLYPKIDRDDARQRQIASDTVRQSELALQKAQNRLQDYTVRAPFDGIVTGLSVDSGDTISQTGVLASVITKKLHVSIELNEVDAAKVKEGDIASVSFVALPGMVINGVLAKLDTIGTVTQNVVSYTAEIELAKQPEGLKPGMTATADVIVAEKKSVLVVPNAALSLKDGKTIVTVVGRNQVATNDGSKTSTSTKGEAREIVIGLSNETNTEVISGLAEGERVQLPTVATSSAATTGASNQGSILNLFRGAGNSGNTRSSGNAR